MASRANDFPTPSAANDQAQEHCEWFSAADLAELALPGLPGDKRSIARRAQDERWSVRLDAKGELLVRPRRGKGGGVEFHFSLLPGAAQVELAKRGITGPVAVVAPVEIDQGGWRWFDAQSDKVKAEAHRRLAIVSEILLFEKASGNRTAAITEAAGRHGQSTSTLWGWMKLIDGVSQHDRLPALAPRRKGGGAQAEIHPLLWQAFKSDYLRLNKPTLASCYARVAAIAAEKGLSMPSQVTFRRRIEKEVDPGILILARGGAEAHRRSIPANRRTVLHLRALEHVNIDGHTFDVFVTPRDGGKPIRPTMVAIQDIYSRKILAWRIGESESAVLTRLAFADLFREFGIPRRCTMDNGRAFASKWITGGTKTRYRFKVKEEEPTGLLTALGVEIKFAKPYRGQSKPIERAFRDLADHVSRDPLTEGAYTGNNPLNKPANYGTKAVAWDAFLDLVERGIHAHNARLGRKSEAARGRSFDETFAESYATAPIGKATPEQLRMALLAGEQILVNRATGEIQLYGNRYWSPESANLKGQRVTVRFDPDNLKSDIYLYDRSGFLCSAQLLGDTLFDDVAGAKEAGKRVKENRDRIRAGLEAERLIAAEELAAMQPRPAVPTLPETTVVRAVRQRGSAAPAIQHTPSTQASPIDRMRAALRVVEND